MTGDEDRLHAQPDFAEWACLLRKQQREAHQLIEMLQPLIDGLYETAQTYPGVAHDMLRLRRKAVVIGEMLETVSAPHEAAVRALTTQKAR
jgi:hypothetical protein